MLKSQRNSGGQLELTRGSPMWVSQESLSGDPKPGEILVEPEGSEQ